MFKTDSNLKSSNDNNTTFNIYQVGDKQFFKVPLINKKNICDTSIHNILVCDTSGSMNLYWSYVANGWNKFIQTAEGSTSILLFDDVVHRITGKTLPIIKPHSGSTNITLALKELGKEIKKYIKFHALKIFFITDGADSNAHNFENRFNAALGEISKPFGMCEFYVLGITSSFPVFISQNIRNFLHNGRSSVPNLFWAQDGSSNDIAEQFESLIVNNKNLAKINFVHGGKKSPFDKIENIFFVGDYVLLDDVNESNIGNEFLFEVDSVIFSAIKTPLISYEMLLDLFRQWIGLIQTKAMNIDIVTDAQILKTQMEYMYSTFTATFTPSGKMLTFNERILNKQLKTYQYQYIALLKVTTELANGLKLKFMTNLELAKQLSSVYVGKYSERNAKMREHTDEDFIKDKIKFIEVLQQLKSALVDVESQDNCVITLDNTLEIIKSDDFIQTLTQCNSKIEFLKSIGVTGSGVLINITDASTINPWVVQVRNTGKYCSTLSTTAIEELNDTPDDSIDLTTEEKIQCVVAIKTGGGTIEKLNSVIPLFSKKIADVIGPIVRTNLFQLICTYSIMKCPMTLNHNAHIGALSGLFGFLLTEPKSEYRDQTVQKIRSTASIYEVRPGLKKFIQTLWTDPNRAVVTEVGDTNPNSDVKCESITKLLLMILISGINRPETEVTEVMTHVWKEYIGRIIGTNNGITSWFSLKSNVDTDVNINEKIDFPDFESLYEEGYTIHETKKIIERKIKTIKLPKPVGLEIILDYDKLYKAWNGGNVGNVSWKGLKTFTKSLGFNITNNQVLQFVTHAIKHSGSNERMEPLMTYEESEDWIMNELLGLKIAATRDNIISQYQILAKDKYFNNYVLSHKTLFPMEKNAIIAEATALGINVDLTNFDELYAINPNNKLPLNACMFKECKHYLVPRKDFGAHIEPLLKDPKFIHAYHRAIFANKSRPVNSIAEKIISGSERPGNHANIGIKRAIVLEKYDDIELNKDIYNAIYGK